MSYARSSTYPPPFYEPYGSMSSYLGSRAPPLPRSSERVRVTIPTYDGIGGPPVFFHWVERVERYFERYQILDPHRIPVARLYLSERAQTFWLNEERRMGHTLDSSPVGWQVMRSLLTYEYFPPRVRSTFPDLLSALSPTAPTQIPTPDRPISPYYSTQRISTDLYSPHQGTRPISDYRSDDRPRIRSLSQKDRTILSTPTPTTWEPEHARSHVPQSTVIATRDVIQSKGRHRTPVKIAKEKVLCYACGVIGHYAVACPTKPRVSAMLVSTSEPPMITSEIVVPDLDVDVVSPEFVEDVQLDESIPITIDIPSDTICESRGVPDLATIECIIRTTPIAPLETPPEPFDFVPDSPVESESVSLTEPTTEGDLDISDELSDDEDLGYPSDLDEDFSSEISSPEIIPLPLADSTGSDPLIFVESSDDSVLVDVLSVSEESSWSDISVGHPRSSSMIIVESSDDPELVDVLTTLDEAPWDDVSSEHPGDSSLILSSLLEVQAKLDFPRDLVYPTTCPDFDDIPSSWEELADEGSDLLVDLPCVGEALLDDYYGAIPDDIPLMISTGLDDPSDLILSPDLILSALPPGPLTRPAPMLGHGYVMPSPSLFALSDFVAPSLGLSRHACMGELLVFIFGLYTTLRRSAYAFSMIDYFSEIISELSEQPEIEDYSIPILDEFPTEGRVSLDDVCPDVSFPVDCPLIESPLCELHLDLDLVPGSIFPTLPPVCVHTFDIILGRGSITPLLSFSDTPTLLVPTPALSLRIDIYELFTFLFDWFTALSPSDHALNMHDYFLFSIPLARVLLPHVSDFTVLVPVDLMSTRHYYPSNQLAHIFQLPWHDHHVYIIWPYTNILALHRLLDYTVWRISDYKIIDLNLVLFALEWIPSGSVTKFLRWSADPCFIFTDFGFDAKFLDFYGAFGVSPSFNFSDFTSHIWFPPEWHSLSFSPSTFISLGVGRHFMESLFHLGLLDLSLDGKTCTVFFILTHLGVSVFFLHCDRLPFHMDGRTVGPPPWISDCFLLPVDDATSCFSSPAHSSVMSDFERGRIDGANAPPFACVIMDDHVPDRRRYMFEDVDGRCRNNARLRR